MKADGEKVTRILEDFSLERNEVPLGIVDSLEPKVPEREVLDEN